MRSQPSLPRERPIPADLEERVWADLVRLMRAEDQTVRVPSSHRRPRSHRRSAVGAGIALVAAIVVLVALVLPSLLPPGSTPGGAEQATAATALRQAAEGTEESALPLGPGEFRYLKTRSIDGATYIIDGDISFSLLVPHESQWWISADGAGVVRSSTGRYGFASPEDQRTYERAGSPPSLPEPHTEEVKVRAGDLQVRKFSSLSTDPEEILTSIRDGEFYGPERDPLGDIEIFTVITDGLRSPVPTPEQKAGLYRAAALIPRVRLFGPMRDSLDRAGTGVGLISDGQADVLIFDTVTGRFLEEGSWSVDPDGTLGELATSSTVVDEAIVNRVGATPGNVINFRELT